MVAHRVEDDPRVAAPHVQDVRTDVEGVVEADGLLEEVGQRQQRDDPVLHRRDDPVDDRDRGDDVAVGQHHALRGARRARGEDELEDIVVARAAARPRPVRSQSAGNEASGSAAMTSTVVVGNALETDFARVRRVPAGAQDQVARARGRTMPSIASDDIRRSSGTRTRPARIAPK